jgi:hypothetical protein
MVRRRSTVRFRNGLRYKTRSEAHWTALILRCGWELSSYWEESGRSCRPGTRVPCGRSCLCPGRQSWRGRPARVSREVRGSTTGTGSLPYRRAGTRFQLRSRPVAIRTRDDDMDRPGYRSATRVTTRGSGTSFRDGLTWADCRRRGCPGNGRFRDGEPGLQPVRCGSAAGHAWAAALVSWLLPAGRTGAEVGRDRAGSGARQCATPSMTPASRLSGTAAACRVVR